jgi:hypothetical protein
LTTTHQQEKRKEISKSKTKYGAQIGKISIGGVNNPSSSGKKKSSVSRLTIGGDAGKGSITSRGSFLTKEMHQTEDSRSSFNDNFPMGTSQS